MSIETVNTTEEAELAEAKLVSTSLLNLFKFADDLLMIVNSFQAVFDNLKPSLQVLIDLGNDASLRGRLETFLAEVDQKTLRKSDEVELVEGNIVKLNLPTTDPLSTMTFIVCETYLNSETQERMVHLQQYDQETKEVLRDEITNMALLECRELDSKCILIEE